MGTLYRLQTIKLKFRKTKYRRLYKVRDFKRSQMKFSKHCSRIKNKRGKFVMRRYFEITHTKFRKLMKRPDYMPRHILG